MRYTNTENTGDESPTDDGDHLDNGLTGIHSQARNNAARQERGWQPLPETWAPAGSESTAVDLRQRCDRDAPHMVDIATAPATTTHIPTTATHTTRYATDRNDAGNGTERNSEKSQLLEA